MSDTSAKSQVGGQTTTTFTHFTLDDFPIVHPNIGALPTASLAYRGRTAYVPGNGTTTADAFFICLMSSTGTYSWKQIITG